jgi:flagellar L-ring protein precursor FlgH
MRHGILTLAVAALLSSSVGCMRHISPYKPKVRKYKAGKYASMHDRSAEGSLFNNTADTLFGNRRASNVGDLITVVISEKAAAKRGAGTELSRSSEASAGVSALVGLMAALKKAHPSIDPSSLLSAKSKNDFTGTGTTQRSGSLEAKLTVRIKKLLPNGDFYIEGHKVVMVNDEETHLYISGVVRPADVQADNSVSSFRVADMQIEYTGKGPVTDKQRPGWFSRIFDWISPF